MIGALLAEEYGVAVTFRESTVICVERVLGCGQAVEVIGTATNPFLATVGLRVEPADVGVGVSFAPGGRAGLDAAGLLRRRRGTRSGRRWSRAGTAGRSPTAASG